MTRPCVCLIIHCELLQMDMDTAIAIFTDTLQQFVNSLQGQVRACDVTLGSMLISHVCMCCYTVGHAVIHTCVITLEPMLGSHTCLCRYNVVIECCNLPMLSVNVPVVLYLTCTHTVSISYHTISVYSTL